MLNGLKNKKTTTKYFHNNRKLKLKYQMISKSTNKIRKINHLLIMRNKKTKLSMIQEEILPKTSNLKIYL